MSFSQEVVSESCSGRWCWKMLSSNGDEKCFQKVVLGGDFGNRF